MNDPRINSEIQNLIKETERLLTWLRGHDDFKVCELSFKKEDEETDFGRISYHFFNTIETIEILCGRDSKIYENVVKMRISLDNKLNEIFEKAGFKQSDSDLKIGLKALLMPKWVHKQCQKACVDHLISLTSQLEKSLQSPEEERREDSERKLENFLEENDEALTMIGLFRERGTLDTDRITRLLNEAGFDATIRDVRRLLVRLEELGGVEKINLDRYRVTTHLHSRMA